MKTIEVLTIATLFLLPGVIAPAYAQGQREPEKQQQARPAQPQQRAQQQQARPTQQPQHAQQQARPAQQPQHAQQQARPAQQPQHAQQQARPAQQPQRAQQQAKPAQQPQRAQQPARPAQPQQRAQQPASSRPAQQSADRARTEPGHGRIPDDRFRASFGRGHTFHVSRTDFVGRSRRFQYGGFWFAMVNPWPVEWLYTDSVYVDYMNGEYFLCDPIHPGVYLSITVG
jgi:hypothetical protein